MLYDIYKDGDLIAETDNVDFVKSVIHEHPNCSVRDAATGREFRIRYVKKASPPAALVASGRL